MSAYCDEVLPNEQTGIKIRNQDIGHSLNIETLQEWVCKIKYSWIMWGFLKWRCWIIDNWGQERHSRDGPREFMKKQLLKDWTKMKKE